jgi:hypothetical protein
MISQSYILLLLNLFALNKAFFLPQISNYQTQRLASSLDQDASLKDEIRSMRAREIKEELTKLGISTVGLFEKEDLINRLLESKKQSIPKASSKPAASPSNTYPKTKGNIPSTNSITAPLYFTTLDTDLRIAAVNMDGGITVNPSEQPYATVKIDVSERDKHFTLQLLLDSACSGFVLRPSLVDKYNLPKMSNPVTMTGT